VKPARIRVHVGGRYAGSRRWVTFTDVHGRATSLAVDERDIEGNLMWVGILEENEGEDGCEVLIRLPRAGLVGEWAAVVPQTSIVGDGTGGAFVALVFASVVLLVLALGTALALSAVA